jgi:hypothetical protein
MHWAKITKFRPDYGDLTSEQLTPGLETGIVLGYYQQEISDRESTIMLYIENSGLWLD